MLEVFSLPPFLDDLEYSLLLHTVRTYPRGLPADDLLFDRNSADRPVSPGGTQQPMARPGKQCRMQCAMAFTTMCHSLSLSISGLCLTFSLCFLCLCVLSLSLPRYTAPVSFSSGMQYVVLKAQRREESDEWWPPNMSWRGMRSSWRWLLGMPPLQNPGERLLEHYTWIQAERERDGDNGGPQPNPSTHQVLSQAENGQAKPGQAKPLSIQRPPPLHLPTIRGPSLDYGQPSPAEMNKAAQEML